MTRTLGSLIALVGLAGCAVGPRYKAPVESAISAGAFRSTGQALDPGAAMPAHWWSLYNDPVLDALVAEALQHNADLRVAAANLERARAVLSGARASLLPTTTENVAVIRGRGGIAGLNGGQAPGTAGAGSTITPPQTGGEMDTVYRLGATFSYEVDLFGRVRRSIQAARRDVEANEATRDATRVTVAAATTQAYLNACAIGRQLDVANDSLRLTVESYDLTRRRLQLGALSEYELSRVGVLVEQTRAQIPQLEGLRASALYDLAVLLGRPASDVPAAAAACHAVPRLTVALPVGDGAAMLRRRPDVREAERTLAADVARVGVATAELFPTISLGGAINVTGTSFNAATTRQGTSFGFGPLISWFFPNILAARSRLQQAGAGARASLAQFDGVVMTALGEAEKALASYDSEIRRNRALTTAQDNSQRAYQLSGVRVRYGTLSQLEQLDVQRDLIAAQAALAASDVQLVANQVAVFRALGGGWQDAPAIDPVPRAIVGTGGIKLKKPQP